MHTKFLIRFSKMYKVSPAEITGKNRSRFLFYLRVIFTYQLQKKGYKKNEIAKFLQRKRSTTGYYMRQFEMCKKQDQKFNTYNQYFKNHNNLWRISNLKRRRKMITSRFQR